MCRMRETNYGSVPAECFGPSMARRVRPLLRLQNHVAGQVFLQGSEAILQRGFLQVSNPLLPTFAFAFFFLLASYLRSSIHAERLAKGKKDTIDQPFGRRQRSRARIHSQPILHASNVMCIMSQEWLFFPLTPRAHRISKMKNSYSSFWPSRLTTLLLQREKSSPFFDTREPNLIIFIYFFGLVW